MSAKQSFLDAYEREHAITMKVLRALPESQKDFRPHPDCRTARELAWVFWAERMLGLTVYQGKFGEMAASGGGPPGPPESWSEILAKIEAGHRQLGDVVKKASDDELNQSVAFFTAPKTLGDVRRLDFLWFLLHDEIHHRGQFSIYLRIAGAKVPSIYGPSKDEPWN